MDKRERQIDLENTINKYSDFNEVDSLILARLSYLPYSEINMNRKETLESISNKMRSFKKNKFVYPDDYRLIMNVGVCNRFRGMYITDFKKKYSMHKEIQFQAITIHINKRILYISFMGTDYSIFGWKEDFNMLYMNTIPFQREATKYLMKIALKYPTKKIIVGGHSKGGNAAVFASISSPFIINNKILRVDNYDGPGFNDKTIRLFGWKKVGKRVNNYTPQESIFGRIFKSIGNNIIIKSDAKGLYQHHVYNWYVTNNEFLKYNEYTKKSNDINYTINRLCTELSVEQRKQLVETLFKIFNEVDTDQFNVLLRKIPKYLPGLIKKYAKLDVQEKEMVISVIRLAFVYYKEKKKNN